MSDPYLYYNSIKDTPVCGHMDFNCLKLKYDRVHPRMGLIHFVRKLLMFC